MLKLRNEKKDQTTIYEAILPVTTEMEMNLKKILFCIYIN